MISIRRIGVIGRTYRHLNRYRQILGILFKYGFGSIIERLNIDEYIEVGLRMISKDKGERVEKLTTAVRVRMAIEELGPAFIKLGQVLSTRTDLISADFIHELHQLQDRVPSVPFDEIKETLEREFQLSVDDIFDDFAHTPIGSASIGQVHKARLKNGEALAVKVQRPGIQELIEVDLEIMLHLAFLMERHIEEVALHRPAKFVEEFARGLEKELDYAIEASNMEQFARQFLDDSTVYVPKYFRELSTERVLTMEFIEGIKISEIEQLEASGLDRKLINIRGARFFLRQVFEHGYFHAEPHPGNICVLPDNIICLFDLGRVGTVDRHTREDFVDLLESMVLRNELGAARILLKLTSWEEEPDIRVLEKDLADLIGLHLYKPLKDIKIGKVLQQLLDLTARHRLIISPDIFFMMKVFVEVEGISVLLNPDFDMVTEVVPFIKRVKVERYSPGRLADGASRVLFELLHFVRQFPKDTLEITRLIRQQKLSVKLEHQGLETILATHEQISSRISFSIIIAALIIGSSLIVVARIPPLYYGISIAGIIVFIAAAIMGIWLLIAIFRRGGL